jgi:hypothetical protein
MVQQARTVAMLFHEMIMFQLPVEEVGKEEASSLIHLCVYCKRTAACEKAAWA